VTIALDAPVSDRAPFSWLRVRTVVRRHGYVLFRSPHRWFDIAFWPVFDVLLWGSLGAFVAQQNHTSRATTPYLLAGIMLFHVLFQSQIAVATGFMEETWTRNILNVMTTPLREIEYVVGLGVMGLIKLVAAMGTVSLTAFAFYRFGLGEIGIGLVPIIGVLLLVGWSTSMLVIGLLLRFGQSAEILAWATTFTILAVSGVFNPVDSIPGPIQPIAKLLPTTYAFKAARELLDKGPVPWNDLGWAALGAFVLAGLSMVFVLRMLRTFRNRGFVTRYS
jgi:ABC-2 type transport system permease protein